MSGLTKNNRHSEVKQLTYILHELAAHWTDFLTQCCTEHHDLLLMRCDPEDVLNITPHVCHVKKEKE